MPIRYDIGKDLRKRAHDSLEDQFKRTSIAAAQDVFYEKRRALVAHMPHWEKLRTNAALIRDHVNENLDFYVKRFVERASEAGVNVHLAPTGEDALREILGIFEEHDAHACVKSKSMLTEEIGMNEALEQAGVKVVETDCGEHILQTAGHSPSHIVVPALHLGREAIAKLYREKEGYEGSPEPKLITHFLRTHLRKEFLCAPVGVQGCNFAVAETGSVTLVTNEGNGRMVSSIPPVNIVVVGIDRIVPDLRALDVFCALLARSAVGSKVTSYFTLDTGPRRSGELDGPAETHYVLVDNRRSQVLAGEFAPMLRCIRCGACLNICPVYRHISGHGYGSIYPGPMGIVLTPALEGYNESERLPFACTLCGACDDDCPVRIPLHELIRLHRVRMVEAGFAEKGEARMFRMAGRVLSSRWRYNLSTRVAAFGMKAFGGRSGRSGSLDRGSAWMPLLGSWTESRDFPCVRKQRFRDWLRENEGGASC